jgi:8-oxo-dGTP pyrophosphatase MutT (NUDIX family)
MSREAVRVVLLDENEQVILVRFWDGDESWWCAPGGGVEPGEDHEDAARREVAEELGLTAFELGPCIWTRHHVGVFRGDPFDQIERIFLGRTSHFTPLLVDPHPEHTDDDIRWWPLDVILATDEVFSPRRFPELLQKLLSEGPPAKPFDTGV